MSIGEPQVLHVRRRAVEVAVYRGRHAQDSDFATLIDEPTLVYDDEARQLTVVYLAPIEEDTTALLEVLRRIRIDEGARTAGIVNRSRVVGSTPRNTLRQEYCTAASLAAEDPEAHARICAGARVVARYYQAYGPALYAEHQEMAELVLPEWRLDETAFTSGIVNRDSRLAYHYDTGNFRNVWSGMLGFKRGVRGGHLAVPQYDVGFEIADKSLLLFDGQGLLHGVTGFHIKPGGWRYTVVYYSRVGMWDCLAPGDELARIEHVRTERELKRE
jgi:hypothetical protein